MSRLDLSPTQNEFFKSQMDYTLFCGGLGSGKTFAGAVWAMSMALKYPKTRGLITANSYKQLQRATLITMFKIMDELGVKYTYWKQEGTILIGDAIIDCVSMENYDNLRGPEYGWGWSDECAFYKKEAFDVLIARIRDRNAPCYWKGTTTPNGFNWLYTDFVEEPLAKSTVIRSKTAQNAANLRDGYVEALSGQYDSKLAQQELDGEFVNLTSGNVYYAFDRRKHCTSFSGDGTLIYVGLDFNVHPLCGVFCVQTDKKIHVVDELYLEDSNTFQAAKEVVRRYPYQTVQIVSDDSGTKRNTAAPRTDQEILRRAGLDVMRFRNPRVKSRYNNVNRLFDHGLLVVDPKCKKLIEDLEKMTYDNKDPMLSHISDALGYVTWKLSPLKPPRREASVEYR